MINADMKSYVFYTLGATKDAYGQEQIDIFPVGTIKMAINTISQTIGSNINYKDATYLGLTQDTEVNDTYVIDNNGVRLKVLYIIPKGRFKQVFMSEMGATEITVLDSGVI